MTDDGQAPTYLHVSLQLHRGKAGAFAAVMEEIAAAVSDAAGWRLVGCFITTIGTLDSAVDLWEVPSANHVAAGLAALGEHPKGPEWVSALRDIVAEEHLKIMSPTAMSPHP